MTSNTLKAAILIISDTASADASTDKTAPVLRDVFSEQEQGGATWEVTDTKIVPDDVDEIQRAIKLWADFESPVNCIITSGGTGFAVKDRTPEAIEPLIHKQASGLVHAMLSSSLTVTPFAMMSRPVAGVRYKTLIITLPGSPKGAKENLESIVKLLPHACIQAAGTDSRQIHAGGVRKLEKEAGVGDGASSAEPRPSHDHSHHHHHHGPGGFHHGPKPHTKPESNDPSAGPTRRARISPYPMLSVSDALALINQHTPPPTIATFPVDEELVGHVLSGDVRANEAVPAFRASIVDGYAVRIPASGVFEKGVYPVAMVSHARGGQVGELQEGSIARITTGAPLPPGASAVVMVEDTALKSVTGDGGEEAEVEILTSDIKPGENVREVGSDVKEGEVIMRKGEGISAVGGELGLLTSVGLMQVVVYKKPVVGILSTGDEIVGARYVPLQYGEVRDTNRPTLLTAVRGSGFEAIDLGIVSDKPGALESVLRAALRQTDVLITTGGVSMGELDLLKPTIERQLGGTIHFGRVAMKPGKPTTFASVVTKNDHGDDVTKLIFSLPGNPASAMVTFHLFVLPALHQMSGIEPAGLPRAKVVLDERVRCDKERAEYVRVVASWGADGRLHVQSTGGQRSSRIGSFKGANALLCLPAKEGVLSKGALVDALIMGRIHGL